MLNSLKSKMIDKLVENIPTGVVAFLDKVSTANPVAQSVVKDTMEALVFPWYEAQTGNFMTSKVVRQAVADRIHLSLQDVHFVPRDQVRSWKSIKKPGNKDYIDGQANGDRDQVKYLVQGVTPAYLGNGEYDIVIMLAPLDNQMNSVQCNLTALLCNFTPCEQVKNRDYDA